MQGALLGRLTGLEVGEFRTTACGISVGKSLQQLSMNWRAGGSSSYSTQKDGRPRAREIKHAVPA